MYKPEPCIIYDLCDYLFFFLLSYRSCVLLLPFLLLLVAKLHRPSHSSAQQHTIFAKKKKFVKRVHSLSFSPDSVFGHSRLPATIFYLVKFTTLFIIRLNFDMKTTDLIRRYCVFIVEICLLPRRTIVVAHRAILKCEILPDKVLMLQFASALFGNGYGVTSLLQNNNIR